MADQDMLAIAKSAIATAKAKGAQEAASIVRTSRNVDVQWRDGKLEKISEATSRGLDLRLFVDGRYSVVSTSDLRPEGLASFIETAVALARTLAKDPARTLPDPALYKGAPTGDLQIADPRIEGVTAIDLRHMAEAMEGAARGVQGHENIVSVTTYASQSFDETFQVHSNGFEGSFRAASFSLSADVSIKDDDGRRPEDGEWSTVRFLADAPDPAVLGRKSAERALSRRGAKKGASAVAPVVVDNRAAGTLLRYLFQPLNAQGVQQKRSFFEGLAGKPFGSDKLDIADDPLLPRGLGTRPFDGEGIASKRLVLFEKGVLRNLYVDTYYGKKTGMAPTTGSISNLGWKLGTKDRAGLIADVKDGILVTGFLGGNSNGTTGDFSLGVQGFAIRGGKLAEPIGEMNISGNHREVWKRLVAVGNDPFLSSSMRAPTLVLDGIQIAGT
jgi:PmbA protein